MKETLYYTNYTRHHKQKIIKEMKLLRISELANKCNLPVTTINFYYNEKLISPIVTFINAVRLAKYFDDSTVKRIKFIQKLKAKRFFLNEIKEELIKYDKGQQ